MMNADTSTRAREALRRTAQRTTDWRFHCWYWGDAIAVDGLMEADTLGLGPYREHVLETLWRWHRHCPPNFDDALAPGGTIIRLVMEGELPTEAGNRMLSLLEALPRAHGAVPALEPHRPLFRHGLCIDALYHLPATYAMAARWKEDSRLADKAVQIALDGMHVLRSRAGWSQWFDPVRKRNNDVAWTRGMGWAALGLLDLVHLVSGVGLTSAQGLDEAKRLAAEVLQRLAGTQQADGHWPAVLDHAPADSETSTAAFYVAAALHPAAAGLAVLPASVLERAISACRRALSDDGTYTGATADVLPSWDIRTYEHCPTEPSPWAQGAAVRAFAALARAPVLPENSSERIIAASSQ